MNSPHKLMSCTELQDALANYLPRRPGYRTIMAAVDAGMPVVKNPTGAKGRNAYNLADCLQWWHSRKTSAKLLVASDAAIRAARGRKPKAS